MQKVMIQYNEKSLVEKFIYSCSHDLRGPVATIQGLVRLAEEYPEQVDSQTCIKMIGECSKKLDCLIHSLQEYMEIERLNVRAEDVEILQIVDEVKEEFSPELATEGILVKSNVNGTRCRTQPHHLREVLKKVIANSIHFRDRNKEARISIAANSDRQGVLLCVKDNGIGIPPDSQPKVFDLFYKAHDISKGSGMGLFLARKHMNKLKGSIRLHSLEGVGTSMVIRLPSVPC
jgi:signal transduction histidine kinase